MISSSHSTSNPQPPAQGSGIYVEEEVVRSQEPGMIDYPKESVSSKNCIIPELMHYELTETVPARTAQIQARWSPSTERGKQTKSLTPSQGLALQLITAGTGESVFSNGLWVHHT